MMCRTFAILVALPYACALSSISSDIISDITGSSADEARALEIKSEAFWKSLVGAAEEMKMEEHFATYAQVDSAIKSLPAQNEYVREALTEALMRARRADEVLLKQAVDSSKAAAEQLATPVKGGGDFFSFITGGQGFFSKAIKGFVDGGQYSQKLVKHIDERQADILPMLRGVADVTSNVLSDCRLASKRSFDVLKYDIYNKDVPKTPEAAKEAANRLIDAAGESRKRFTSFIREAANSITQDVTSRHEDAATTVVKEKLKNINMPATGSPRIDFGAEEMLLNM